MVVGGCGWLWLCEFVIILGWEVLGVWRRMWDALVIFLGNRAGIYFGDMKLLQHVWIITLILLSLASSSLSLNVLSIKSPKSPPIMIKATIRRPLFDDLVRKERLFLLKRPLKRN